MNARLILLAFLVSLLLSACAQGQAEIKPPEIHYGEDICRECQMIISDERFASAYVQELSQGRYESIAFDDIGDMLAHAANHPEHAVVAWYVHDYESKEWLDATRAYYVFSDNLQTPMGQGTAALKTGPAAEQLADEIDGELLAWDGLRARFDAGELMVHVHEYEGEMPGNEAIDMDHVDAMNHDVMHSEHDAMHQQVEEILLGEAEIAGYHLELVSHAPLYTGYNEVMVHMNDADGGAVSDLEITFSPRMAMTSGMDHAAGVEQPQAVMPGMYHGAIAFPMPSGPDLGAWTLTVILSKPGAETSGEATFDIEVLPSKVAGSFVAPDERKIFIMAVQPTIPQVGTQPFQVYAMQKLSDHEWLPLDDLTLEMTPYMPSMDHGSPTNEHPLSTSNGHYEGLVNFTMAGPWTVTVVAIQDGQQLGEVVFEYVVP